MHHMLQLRCHLQAAGADVQVVAHMALDSADVSTQALLLDGLSLVPR